MAQNSSQDESWVVINPLRPESNTNSQPAQGSQTSKGKTKRSDKVPCRFWGTAGGCRAGEQCRFYHDPSLRVDAMNSTISQTALKEPTQRYTAPPVTKDRVVSKPVSSQQKKNPQTFEIDQLRRRFSPQESSTEDEITLEIKMPPSDPDFPFDLPFLDCVLHVPATYPTSGTPSLDVRNKEMERIHQAAIERGFRDIVSRSPQATLLAYFNSLDKQLESFLSGKKEEIKFKLIANRASPKEAPEIESKTTDVFDYAAFEHALPVYTAEELDGASKRRETETRQLDARLGRLPLFAKIDEYTYTLPLEPRFRDKVPASLQWIKSVHLHVPGVYPLEPCSITIPGVLDEAAVLAEVAFEERTRKHAEQTLLFHVNYLAQNLHVLATHVEEAPVESVSVEDDKTEEVPGDAIQDKERSHIRLISRPPEWEAGFDQGHSDSDWFESGTDEEDEDSIDEEGEEQEGAANGTSSTGHDQTVAIDLIGLSFPRLQSTILVRKFNLGYAELAEITTLCLTIQCRRCKTVADMPPLTTWEKSRKPKLTEATSTLACPRCTSQLSITYHPKLMFPNSGRAGTLDLSGCRVMDMSPSRFLLTCATCMTADIDSAPLSFSAQRHRVSTQCTQCKTQVTLQFDRAHFLKIWTTSRERLPAMSNERRAPRLQSLPQNGICEHYARSYRWFRFGCCARMYACDKCHDSAETHVAERAARMLCGFCAREQAFRPLDCASCGAMLVNYKHSGHGFWEGGKGTRERRMMSRKDPRKYKRIGAVDKKKETGKEKAGDKGEKGAKKK